jgi:hypothetical protein
MAELSPAAQAILDAMYEVNVDFCDENRDLAAAALRAVADLDETLFDIQDELVPAVCAVRTDRLLAIAAELDGAK